MRPAEILTIRAVAGPFFDFRPRIRIVVDVFRSTTNDTIGVIKGDNFTTHLLILLLSALAAF